MRISARGSWPTTRASSGRAALTAWCRPMAACTGCRWPAIAGKCMARFRWPPARGAQRVEASLHVDESLRDSIPVSERPVHVPRRTIGRCSAPTPPARPRWPPPFRTKRRNYGDSASRAGGLTSPICVNGRIFVGAADGTVRAIAAPKRQGPLASVLPCRRAPSAGPMPAAAWSSVPATVRCTPSTQPTGDLLHRIGTGAAIAIHQHHGPPDVGVALGRRRGPGRRRHRLHGRGGARPPTGPLLPPSM